MKKLLLLSLFSLFVFSLSAQEVDAITKLIREGISLHDKRDYRGAIEKYDQVLQYDSENITALAEKAFSLLSLREYKSSIDICKKLVKKYPDSKKLKFVYTTYANALDGYKKPEKAVKIYNQGIKKFPDFYQLHFNKGITLSGLQKYDEALESLHQSAQLKPSHAGTHNAIARLLMMKGNKIPALMAFCRFSIVEPQGRRAEANFPFIEKILAGNAKKTGENNVTINVSSAMLENAANKKKEENNFGTTEFLLSMSSALDFDEKNKDKTKRELFMDKLETMCSSLSETKKDNSGFYWDYYVPYFVALKEKKHLEVLSYLVYAPSDEKEIMDWLKSNKEELEEFYKWSAQFEWYKS